MLAHYGVSLYSLARNLFAIQRGTIPTLRAVAEASPVLLDAVQKTLEQLRILAVTCTAGIALPRYAGAEAGLLRTF